MLTSSTVDAQTVNRNNNNDSNSLAVVGSVIAVISIIALASVLATVIGLLILWRKRREIIFKGGKSFSTEREVLQDTLVGLINHTYQDTSILVSKDFNNPLYGGMNNYYNSFCINFESRDFAYAWNTIIVHFVPYYADVEEETTYSAPFHPPEFTASYSIYEACEPNVST